MIDWSNDKYSASASPKTPSLSTPRTTSRFAAVPMPPPAHESAPLPARCGRTAAGGEVGGGGKYPGSLRFLARTIGPVTALSCFPAPAPPFPETRPGSRTFAVTALNYPVILSVNPANRAIRGRRGVFKKTHGENGQNRPVGKWRNNGIGARYGPGLGILAGRGG